MKTSKILAQLPSLMVGRFRGDDPRFCDFQSDWVPILYLNTIWLTLSFCRKNWLVSIMVSSWFGLRETGPHKNLAPWLIRPEAISASPMLGCFYNTTMYHTERTFSEPVPLCKIYCRTWTNVKSLKFVPILLCQRVKCTKHFFLQLGTVKCTKIVRTLHSST